jgi:hypothetical protein
MLRIRFTDGPRKGEIAFVDPAAGWAMLADGRATDPRLEAPLPAMVAEVAATPTAAPATPAISTRHRRSRP